MRPLLIPAIGLPSGEHISDARLFVVALVALAGCILWQGIVAWRHRRALRSIPVRIHVAGTRGKSTTTRLIAAALRASGRRVVAKTTGSEPRLILPDGREEICLVADRHRSASRSASSDAPHSSAPTRSWSNAWRSVRNSCSPASGI